MTCFSAPSYFACHRFCPSYFKAAIVSHWIIQVGKDLRRSSTATSCSKAGSAMRLEIWNYFISMAVFHLLSVVIYSNISFMQECCWQCIYLEFSWKAAMKSVCSCSGYRKRTGQFRLPSASKCTFAPVALSEWNPSKDISARPSDTSSSSFEGSRTSLIFLSWMGGRKKKTHPTKTQTSMVRRIRAKN